MPHVVIIGAGPAGLYFASNLEQKGIKDIAIYDLRAGDYVRPGALNIGIFQQAESGIQAPLHFNKATSHIRDIEKCLYRHVVSKNITVEKKQFMRFSEEPKGIYVAYKNEQQKLVEEFVSCDYVFDCTGSKRALAHEVNKKCEIKGMPRPFEISVVSKEVIVKKYLIAYLKIDNNIAAQARSVTPDQKNNLTGKTHLEYIQAIEKLRLFGWTEFTLPDCHHTHFKENKNCFYIDCPSDLLPEHQSAWMETVLSILTNKTAIQYEPMESKKGRSKPNFTTFVVNPKKLNCFTYQEEGLPHISILGDGQIEPNFVLGHGIKGTFERIDLLMNYITIADDGKIANYDASTYNLDVNNALKAHGQEIFNYYLIRKLHFRKGVYEAKIRYEAAITETTNPAERDLFRERLREINARIAFYEALKPLEGGNAPSNLDAALKEFTDAKNTIVQSLKMLTEFELAEATEKLQRFIIFFRTIGNRISQKAYYSLAIKIYEEALSIYSVMNMRADVEKLNLYSELILCYRKLGQLEEVFAKFKEASSCLDLANNDAKKKILFHFVKAVEENVSKLNSDSQRLDILSRFASLTKTHLTFIAEHLKDSLKVELKRLDDCMASFKHHEMELGVVINI
ncbi:hypothetical protein ACQUW5_06100 [Legionella sp. CNM-1927-20]|uniref:hypothetical protein n=1 Tax=Legionella sp. CNM-1927-20 TaxID=3422221 RepID=UPI00403A84C0